MKLKNAGVYVLGIYLLCYFFRIVEYFGIRTDQTIIGEAFIHKLIGIVIIILVMKKCSYHFEDIGIMRKGCIRYTFYGLAFGLAMFLVGYGTEVAILRAQGKFQSMEVYVSSYAVDQNIAMESGMLFLIICIVGNIVNVMMEETLFRGVFQKIMMRKFSFVKAAVFCSILFGLWHVIGPIRNYMDGISSLQGTIANILMLFITSGLIAFKFAMLSRLEGALYMGMADHFVNNTIVNLLHVTSSTGTDEMMFVRISIAQSISFVIVLLVFLNRSRGISTERVLRTCK
ncbi:MAG: CPBP family intramembrane metalloprotease [Lachnospiraceae bacterium]|nr:CPBP family intramembrane metalloprotease [Lachnospiraceae bacterium]